MTLRIALPAVLTVLLVSGCSAPGQDDVETAGGATKTAPPVTAPPSTAAERSASPAGTPLPTSTPAPTPARQAGDLRVHPLPGGEAVEMVYVPGGTLPMGSRGEQLELARALCEGYPDAYGKCEQELFLAERPQHPVEVEGFWLDRTEVTNSRYDACVAAGACRASRLADEPAYNGDHSPVAGVPWQDAADYCAWAGARLPTEAEWEYAARGEQGEVFPWGQVYECGRANLWEGCSGCEDGYRGPSPVGAFPAGASWCGALDMAGNAWEWVADAFREYGTGGVAPTAGSEETRVLRGGSWGYCPAFARGAYRYPVPAGADYLAVGFRCAMPAGE